MNIITEKNNDLLTIALEGELDALSAPLLDKEINDKLGDCNEIVFDMEKLEYISSAGLRVLLTTQKLMNDRGSMKLKNVADAVMDVFDITGFSDILSIE
ncbi:MAG: STAS domain-containing protein [Ruminiclostridium sp.]